MGAITRIAVGETSEERGRKRFRSATRTQLAPDVHARQSRIALLAFQSFPDREAALLFLNGDDDALGGRPIDVASASEAGAGRVAAALRSRGGHAAS
ncbi:hypothetical protein Q9Q95_14285 [Sphingomonas sp. DG1-23]|uniref:hypothetical protein n=1 Tax=Sphingomonas sp. DG1-23 TaxID=3068316 RepID=UPI00273FC117|nr:hypothetical protein [Sphingomonas sp. DG1-23]MDP5280095.1 hypothetical protein [Sphingomonas sp. DG1-23]